ncbi:ion transporter [Kibdelosporangium aridum]|uniref:Ion transporter n=1 Tax=Kibdelosporangium aridum TaxID=2030 RepID=A0A428ZAZ7_KIBAR|nr:ion channel [Kibdelosporangium aridum]RSM85226.1 ion transporter [Kibdelosporangium aridum]
MLYMLSRLLTRLASLTSWVTPAAVILFVFVTSWPLMALAEPAENELVQPANYWWYFVVTAATVGYGDFYPQTAAGHVVGSYVIVGGIATLTTVFTKLASMLERMKGRRMQGTIIVAAAGHIALLGYIPGRTERIVAQLIAEAKDERLVLCAWDETTAHPMPDQEIDFVRGELTDQTVLNRAGVHRARTVLVDARDDNEALAIAVTVNHLNTKAHIVIALRDMERAQLVRYVDGNIRCVQWHTPRMITEELTSPGIAEVYAELMSPDGANTYSIRLSRSLGPLIVEHCQMALGRRFGATLLAVSVHGRLIVNPGWHTELPPGAVLYYVSPRRLGTEELTTALRSGTPSPGTRWLSGWRS